MFEDVLIFKKGGIHIKKKNRGKFTEYCGGKVTEECIAKGKKSKDPKIRKRATFADNARKWKHENGGILKYQNPAIPLDLPEGSAYGGELEPAVVKPKPYWGELNTYYPAISAFPFTGHSELNLYDSDGVYVNHISKYRDNYDYNLVTNNCSDATRCAVEQVFGKKINPILFTTPGDVQDFVVEQTGSNPYWSDRGRTSVRFEIPFATAMDLKNQNIDFLIQNYLKNAELVKKRMHEKAESRGGTWNSSGYDASTRKIIEGLENQRYTFQPFKNKDGGILKAQEGTATSSERIPTLEEYIQMKQQEARQMALANSYNATEPRLAKRYYTDKEIKLLEGEAEAYKNVMDAATEEIYKYENMLRKSFTPSHVFVPDPRYIIGGQPTGAQGDRLLMRYEDAQENASYYKKHYKESTDRLELIKKTGYDWTGSNCITNATGW